MIVLNVLGALLLGGPVAAVLLAVIWLRAADGGGRERRKAYEKGEI